MNIIAITGPRKLTDLQAHKVSLEMVDVLIGKYVLMGDAAGVDAIAQRLNTQLPGAIGGGNGGTHSRNYAIIRPNETN